MAAPHTPSYINAPPIAFTPVEQDTATTLDGKVSWTWDDETGTLETRLPDGGKLYLLANDVEALYDLLHSVAPRLAKCSKEVTKRLHAGYAGFGPTDDTVIYSPSKHAR